MEDSCVSARWCRRFGSRAMATGLDWPRGSIRLLRPAERNGDSKISSVITRPSEFSANGWLNVRSGLTFPEKRSRPGSDSTTSDGNPA